MNRYHVAFEGRELGSCAPFQRMERELLTADGSLDEGGAKALLKFDFDVASVVEVLHAFDTEEEARGWMDGSVDDPCVDNSRFAFEDDPEGVALYEEWRASGCCGSSDATVVVAGRRATVGCNYGH